MPRDIDKSAADEVFAFWLKKCQPFCAARAACDKSFASPLDAGRAIAPLLGSICPVAGWKPKASPHLLLERRPFAVSPFLLPVAFASLSWPLRLCAPSPP